MIVALVLIPLALLIVFTFKYVSKVDKMRKELIELRCLLALIVNGNIILSKELRVTIATPKQQEYIEILANDLLFDRKDRNTWICSIIGRKARYLDELTVSEASTVIKQFLEWKEQRKESTRATH